MNKEPLDPLSRYAYGYSDEKPSKGFLFLIACMVIYVVYNMIGLPNVP